MRQDNFAKHFSFKSSVILKSEISGGVHLEMLVFPLKKLFCLLYHGNFLILVITIKLLDVSKYYAQSVYIRCDSFEDSQLYV